MKITQKSYKATAGYHDTSLRPFGFTVHYNEGKVIAEPIGSIQTMENEIQISGDEELRFDKLPPSEDGSSILFLSDLNYNKALLRRRLTVTKDIPIDKSDDFVRAWAALAIGDKAVLDGTNKKYCDGGSWGDIDDLKIKKMMIKQIKNMSTKERSHLSKVKTNKHFDKDYLSWRGKIKIEYKK